MKFTPQSISDVILIEPAVHSDGRGYFMESFKQDVFENALGYKVDFIQDNESKSKKGVLRGLHYQLPPYSQAKLVRVIEGSVLDVAVDIRKSSATYGKQVTIELTGENKKQLFIPRGFAHGFVVLSNSAIFSYKVDNNYTPQHEHTILWNDVDLNIDWHLDDMTPSLSNKDKDGVSFQNAKYYD